ncbi:translation initiation factor SUI1 [Gymnopilus junonius]|uniref:Translation machinery-associated protein 22 n=1 Tax=Gymnopilus junonius TaxID=109634 RepID=A0A9P5TV83_GYMJU|nr:translation initiation factor SUI1 [Gymnopilus junonius]
MGRKRAQSPPRQAAPTEDEGAGSSSQQPVEPPKEPTPPVRVIYCDVCSFPLEYCEFGSSFTRCKESLKESNEELYNKYYSDEALQSKIGTLSLEAQKKLEKDAAKKEAKAEAKADAALKKKLASQVTIKRIERTKRKHVTAIHGLEAFSIDLKKAAKQLAGRFATGASVTKNAQGLDEIVVQGDVSDEILEILEKGEGVLKGVPIDNVQVVEDKKKKTEG